MVTHMLYESTINYKINKVYEEYISFYLTYERTFNEKFIENKEFKLFPHGYAGLYYNYDLNGCLISSFYHTNGKIHGEELIYNNDGSVKLIYYYKKGKKRAEFNTDTQELTYY